MTTDGDRGATPPADELQFDHAEYAAKPARSAVMCAACSRPIAETYYEVGGKVLCGGCRDAVIGHFTGGSRLARFLRAGLFGSLAALGGAGLFYLVAAVTGSHWGVISILVGVMVGKAVSHGSRHRGGLAYQTLAIFLTYTAIVSSYLPIIVPQLFAEFKKASENKKAAPSLIDPARPVAKPEQVEGDAKPTVAVDPAGPRPVPGPEKGVDAKPEPINAAGFALGWVLFGVVCMAFAYALPFLQGAENLMGLIIIFFGLLQAWRLNRKVRPEIKGPFLVGAGGLPPREAPADA